MIFSSLSSMVLMSSCRADIFSGAKPGSGIAGPSRPDSPCTISVTPSSKMDGRISGWSAPMATGMLLAPAKVSTRRALRVVFSRVWFPATMVTALISSFSGSERAHSIARASSCPGSQSIIIGIFLISILLYISCRNAAAIGLIVLENSEFQRFQFGGKHLVHGGSRSSCTIPGNTDTGCLGGDLHGLLHRPALCLSA